MRLFLLLALLLRFAPTQVLGAHCAEADSAIPAASHAHHDAPPADDSAADCSHCPPSECAAQPGCTVATAHLATTNAAAVDFASGVTRPEALTPDPLRSQPSSPPVPPPVIHSA